MKDVILSKKGECTFFFWLNRFAAAGFGAAPASAAGRRL
jgi:hypothetical protein